VNEEKLAGAVDADVYAAAQKENRILITLDLDFADIRTYPPSETQGIWVLRSGSHDIKSIVSILERAVLVAERETTAGRVWIVEPSRVRIRS
jgi:predicted nuclease of predicted toxin-antitoxin system